MKLSVILATKGRGEQAVRCINRFYETVDDFHIELIIIAHPEEATREAFKQLPKDKDITVYEVDCRSIEAYNIGASKSTGDWVLGLDDDAWFHDGWFEKLMETVNSIPNNHGYVKIQSDNKCEWAERAICSRKFLVEELGGVMCIPHYLSQYDDVEKTDRAKIANLWFESDAYIEHRHPAHNKAPMDSTYQDGFARYAGIDGITYNLRKQAGFPNDYESYIK